MTFDLSTIELRPQTNMHDCAVTVLEYLTGIDRADIVVSIGPDGNTPVNGEKKTIGTRMEEMVTWLNNKRSYRLTRIVSRTWAQKQRGDKEHSCQIVDNVKEEITGKIAIVGTETVSTSPCGMHQIFHVYAWVGDKAIDPAFGRCRKIRDDREEIIEAITIENLSIDQVIKTLKKLSEDCD